MKQRERLIAGAARRVPAVTFAGLHFSGNSPEQMVALILVTLGNGEASARSDGGLLFLFCSISVWAQETGGSRPGRSSSHIQFKPPAGGVTLKGLCHLRTYSERSVCFGARGPAHVPVCGEERTRLTLLLAAV